MINLQKAIIVLIYLWYITRNVSTIPNNHKHVTVCIQLWSSVHLTKIMLFECIFFAHGHSDFKNKIRCTSVNLLLDILLRNFVNSHLNVVPSKNYPFPTFAFTIKPHSSCINYIYSFLNTFRFSFFFFSFSWWFEFSL